MTATWQQFLGLCLRAGCLVSGNAAVQKTVREKKAKLFLVAGDASPRTKEQFSVLAKQKRIPLVTCGSKEEFGRVLQKPPRSIIAVTDQQFARGLLRALERGEGHIMSGSNSRR